MSLFHQRGRAGEAIELLQANLREKEDHDLSYSYLSSLYLESGRPGEALGVLRRGLEKLPGNYTIFLAYISTLLQLGRYEEVIGATDRVQSFPQAQNDPEIWNSLGAAFLGLGRFDEALDQLEKALSIDPDFPAALSNRGFALLLKARYEKNRLTLDRAVDSFREAIAKNRSYAPAYNGLGAAYKTAGNTEAAISSWQQALQLDPGLDQVLYNLGFAYLEKGEKDRAREYLLEYKERVYRFLSPAEQRELDELINRTR